MTVFDPVGGSKAKAEGMERADRAANPEWKRFMLQAIKEICLRKPFMFTDDLELLRVKRDGPTTHENRAIGPLMISAQKLGYCVPTDHWVPSSQKVNHRRHMRVWFSLIYHGNRGVKRPRRLKVIDPRQFDLEV